MKYIFGVGQHYLFFLAGWGGAVFKIFRGEEGWGSHFSRGLGGRASLACANTA